MSVSPMSPPVSPNVEFLEHYIDCVENLPLDVQRYVSQLREYDMLYKTKLDQVGHLLALYRSGGNGKRNLLVKLQKCLIKSQQYGDEKLNIIAQMAELVESRTSQLTKDAMMINTDKEDNTKNNSSNNQKVKVEKTQKSSSVEKHTKSIYDKPKRNIRRRAPEKSEEKMDRPVKDLEENEEDEMILGEEYDTKAIETAKPKKDIFKKNNNKEKLKDKAKEEKEEKKEDKRTENKNNRGKVVKKINTKQTSRIKKKKKKEKELSVDIPVDPDEPTYCICSSISYGEMIGCDNDDCQIEWFHFGCVNLTHKPKGKWYCPQCTSERKDKSKK